jgi:ABC-type molybdate transport system substrate-binding protein
MQSAAFKEAYLELLPSFERVTGHEVVSLWVSTVNMLSRLQSGGVDLVIGPVVRMDEMTGAGLIVPASRTDVARSGIGVAVRAGAPRPDLSSGEALKRAVLAARSLVYSTGPSGIYLARLFERMGISGEIKGKADNRRTDGRGGGARRSGDRLSADERVASHLRHRSRGAAAGGDPGDHHVHGGRTRARERAGAGESADRSFQGYRRASCYQEVGHGARVIGCESPGFPSARE